MADAVVSEKQCARCGKTADISFFPIVNRSKTKPQGNHSCTCRSCMKAYKDERKAAAEERISLNPPPPGTIRVCAKCGQSKPLTEYHKAKAFEGGHVYNCRVCVSDYKKANRERFTAQAREYRANHRQETREMKRAWAKANPDKVKAYNARAYRNNIDRVRSYRQLPHVKARKLYLERIWRKNNPHRIVEYNERRARRYHSVLKLDPKHVVNSRVQHGIAKTLRGKKDRRPWESLVGYSVEDLIKHLKRTMPKGYTWDDVISGELHIDHIDPVSAFNFTSHTDMDFKKCWALKNLRLLPAFDNISKGAKILRPVQPSFAGI